MKKNTITPEDLRKAKCAKCNDLDPNCDQSSPLVLGSVCHTGEGTNVMYVKKDHALVIECATCHKHIVTIDLEPQSAPRRKEKKPSFYTCGARRIAVCSMSRS